MRDVRWMGLHGDTLCHQDTSYQGYRRLFQTRFIGGIVRSMPPSVKRTVIRQLRATSKQKLNQFEHERHTLSRYRLRCRFQSDVDHLICGHLHDPGRLNIEIRGEEKTLWILGDWLTEGGVFLTGAPGNPRLVRYG